MQVDPNRIFAGIDLSGLCQGGGILTISESEHPSLAERALANLAESFSLAASGGHHHH